MLQHSVILGLHQKYFISFKKNNHPKTDRACLVGIHLPFANISADCWPEDEWNQMWLQNCKCLHCLRLGLVFFSLASSDFSIWWKPLEGTFRLLNIGEPLPFFTVSHFSFSSALTEKIVSVLPKMKCPHRLEPHQIQGLDFIHIFPVVQVWALRVNYCCRIHILFFIFITVLCACFVWEVMKGDAPVLF